MEESLPQPPMMLRIASVVVIGLGLWLATMVIVISVRVPDPLTALTNILVALPAILLAVEQYLGTYQYNPRAAKISQWLLYGFGGVGIAISGLCIVVGGMLASPGALLFVIPITLGGLSLLMGDMNGRWAAKLSSRRWSHLRDRPFQISISELFTLTTTVAVCMAVSVWMLRRR